MLTRYRQAWLTGVLFLGLNVLSASLSVATDGEASAGVPQLTLLKAIPIGGSGGWDYLCADSSARRLYLPRSTHVQVLDLDTGAVRGDIAITGTKSLHGVALALEQGLGFTTGGRGNNAVSVFDLKTFKVSKTIKAGRSPDSILYDPASKHILAINHDSGDVTVIDPAALDSDPVTIAVGGHALESAVADGEGHVFVNAEDKHETIDIDSKANRVLAYWPLAPGHAPTGLAIDVKRHRLFVGCKSQKMVVLDSTSGKVLAAVPIGPGVDLTDRPGAAPGVVYDPALGVAMSANGVDGTMSVVKETSAGNFETVQTPKTIKGALTVTMDTKKHQALLPCNIPDGKGGVTFGIAVVGVKEAGR